MCGIVGVFGYHAAAGPVDEAELLRMRDSMVRRGPDGHGLWKSPDGRIALGHRRLSIIDLSDAGAQPMSSADGLLHVTFNGEIYNYRQLRRDLELKGYRFRSASDTEVLLYLYADRGEEMVHALRGMFAFAIYDVARRSLFMARDPFGIKPFYYADDGKVFRFASQVKALLKAGSVDTAPSAAGQVGFFLWGHVPEPYTLYKGIEALPAGCFMRVETGAAGRPRPYFNISDEFARGLEQSRPIQRTEMLAQLREAVADSVRHHLVSDVPVGIFLSSGIDSTTIAAHAKAQGAAELRAVTLGFDEYKGTQNDETRLAGLVARHYGFAHHTAWISHDDFEAERGGLLDAMDQPSIDGVNTYFVSRAAARAGMKVAMSGLGGDELFGGYPSFRDIPRMVRAFGFCAPLGRLGRGFRAISAPLLARLSSPKYASLLEYGGSYGGAYLLRRGLYMPWELPLFMDGDLVKEGWAELQTLLRLEETTAAVRAGRQRVSALELSWYMRNQLLRDSDWASMVHSLEVRLPLVDVQLFREVVRLAGQGSLSKQDFAEASAYALPGAVQSRRKTGFSIPLREWLIRSPGRSPSRNQRGLRAWAHEINPPRPKRRRILVLLSDAFGARGGIAKFNRDFLQGLCSHRGTGRVTALPRLITDPLGRLPDRLDYLTEARHGKLVYALELLNLLFRSPRYDLVVSCHINLLPLAWVASVAGRAPLVLNIHGIDAWQPTKSWLTNRLARRVDHFVSVSTLTKNRFLAWAGVRENQGGLLPNSVDLLSFVPRPKDGHLIDRYGLRGRLVVMTVGRLVSEERYKGFDEVIESLPQAIKVVPGLVYMIVGEGSDRTRLEQKVRDLGLTEHVIFTGFVPEDSKCDHYNLADAYVMPSRGEGFGIVFLEAMACGIPVVGSLLDGSKEALRDGQLGVLVNPSNRSEVLQAMLEAVRMPRRIPPGLEYFSAERFESRLHELMEQWH